MTDLGLMKLIPPIGGLIAAVGLILFPSTAPCLFEAATTDYITPTKPCTWQGLKCDFMPVYAGFAPKPAAKSKGIFPDFTGLCWLSAVSDK